MGLLKQFFSEKERRNYSPNKVVHFDLSGNLFSVALPECASEDVPVFSPLMDVYGDELWRSGSEVVFAKLGWEYPGLKLLEKPFGRVDVTVTIFQRSEGANLFSYDQLMTAITDVYQGRYKAFNDDARKNAVTSGHIPTELYYYYPEDESWFHAKDINDNQWLNFNLVGKETHNVYALPISDRHFLMLDYHFDHSPKRGESELRKLGGAAADVEAIVNTMALSYAKVAEGVKTIGN